MSLLLIGLGILIIFLVVTGKWNDFWGVIFNPGQGKG